MMMKRIFISLLLLFLWSCSKAPTESEEESKVLPIILITAPDSVYVDEVFQIKWESSFANDVKVKIDGNIVSQELNGVYSTSFSSEGEFRVKATASNNSGKGEDEIIIRSIIPYPVDVEMINRVIEQTVFDTLTINLNIPIMGYYRTKTFLDYSPNSNEDFYLRVSSDSSNWFGPTNPTEGSYKKVYDNSQEGVNGRYSGIFHLESGTNYIQIIAFNNKLFVESIQFEFVGEQ